MPSNPYLLQDLRNIQKKILNFINEYLEKDLNFINELIGDETRQNKINQHLNEVKQN